MQMQTGTLTKVYGPINDTKYTILEQAVNIRSDPGVAPEEYFDSCFRMCNGMLMFRDTYCRFEHAMESDMCLRR
jgi:hypothetical protein